MVNQCFVTTIRGQIMEESDVNRRTGLWNTDRSHYRNPKKLMVHVKIMKTNNSANQCQLFESLFFNPYLHRTSYNMQFKISSYIERIIPSSFRILEASKKYDFLQWYPDELVILVFFFLKEKYISSVERSPRYLIN